MTIVDLLPNTFLVIPVVVANWSGERDTAFDLAILTDATSSSVLQASLIHPPKVFLQRTAVDMRPFLPELSRRRRTRGRSWWSA